MEEDATARGRMVSSIRRREEHVRAESIRHSDTVRFDGIFRRTQLTLSVMYLLQFLLSALG